MKLEIFTSTIPTGTGLLKVKSEKAKSCKILSPRAVLLSLLLLLCWKANAQMEADVMFQTRQTRVGNATYFLLNIENFTPEQATVQLPFTLTLPAGLVVAPNPAAGTNPHALATIAAPTITAVPGSNTITFSGNWIVGAGVGVTGGARGQQSFSWIAVSSATLGSYDYTLPAGLVNVTYPSAAPLSNTPESATLNVSNLTPNPDFSRDDCEGINVGILLDHSSSMDNTERAQVIAGVNQILDNLQARGNCTASIASFATHGFLNINTTAVTAANRPIFNDFLRTDGAPEGSGPTLDELHMATYTRYSGEGRTNWQAGFSQAATFSQVPDILIFFTDGLPNEPNGEQNNYDSNIEGALIVANTIKSQGTHIFSISVGVGFAATTVDPDPNTVPGQNAIRHLLSFDESQVYTDNIFYQDYFLASNFSQVQSVLSAFTASCNIVEVTTMINGNVYNDANGLSDGTVNGSGTGSPGSQQLFANLVDASNNIAAVVPVNADGTYSLLAPANGTYTVQISTNQGALGSPAPPTVLPSGWVSTGENLGASAGSDGVVNGLLSITATGANIDNANFGIDQIPESTSSSVLIPQPAANSIITLNGISANPPVPAGTDAEDGSLGSGGTIVITTLPTNTTLLYNSTPVTTGQIIPDFDPSLLQVQLTSATIGDLSTSFEFAYQDAAGVEDPSPAIYTLSWEDPMPVTLASFNTTAEGRAIHLTWVTTSEVNTEAFEVQHSTSGKNWNILGTVKAKGESSAVISYGFIHPYPQNGNNLYRLKMIDSDNTFAYSKINSVSLTATDIALSPNPANEFVNVGADAKDITVFGADGKTVGSFTPKTGQIDVRNLSKGIYLFRITRQDGTLRFTRILISK